MKSIKLLIIAAIVVFNFSLVELTKSKTNNEAFFSFNNSNRKLNRASSSNFKGHVGLDAEGRGIVITAGDGGQNESLMRLVSEKLDTDSYLIDYRLMRSCSFNIKFSKDNSNLIMEFSPQSLENRNKNDNFDIQVEIFNFKTFIPENKYKTEDEIKDYLKAQCSDRKKSISTLKKHFTNSISNYHSKYKDLNAVTQKVVAQSQEVENIKTAIQDTESQIKDIKYLQNSYQEQLKSISSLTTGANKLITKESEKTNELLNKEKELKAKISNNFNVIKTKEESLTKLKEKYEKAMEQSKDIESVIINYQKDLAGIENSLSNIRSNKLRLDYDLKAANSQKVQSENAVQDIIAQIGNFRKKNSNNFEKIDKLVAEKSHIENMMNNEREEIKKLEQQINELIVKKSKKEENLKSKFDLFKNKEDEITSLRIENEQFQSNIKRLSEKKEKLEGNDKTEIDLKIENVTKQINSLEEKEKSLIQKQNSVSTNLDDSNKSKEKLNNKITKNNLEMDKINQEIVALNNSRVELEKKKADYANERRDKENKLKNLRNESSNYNGEIGNVKKSLNIAKDNLETFNGILNDFTSKLSPVENKYKQLLELKTKYENEIKKEKKNIKEYALRLKKETPSATIMIDLAEDEAFNDSNEEESAAESKPKWRTLIEKIIS